MGLAIEYLAKKGFPALPLHSSSSIPSLRPHLWRCRRSHVYGDASLKENEQVTSDSTLPRYYYVCLGYRAPIYRQSIVRKPRDCHSPCPARNDDNKKASIHVLNSTQNTGLNPFLISVNGWTHSTSLAQLLLWYDSRCRQLSHYCSIFSVLLLSLIF